MADDPSNTNDDSCTYCGQKGHIQFSTFDSTSVFLPKNPNPKAKHFCVECAGKRGRLSFAPGDGALSFPQAGEVSLTKK